MRARDGLAWNRGHRLVGSEISGMGNHEERRIEERLHKLEEAVVSLQNDTTNLQKMMTAGFAGTHDRLDKINGDLASGARTMQVHTTWQTVHDAMEAGRGQAWGSLRIWLGLGFGAMGALQVAVYLLMQ